MISSNPNEQIDTENSVNNNVESFTATSLANAAPVLSFGSKYIEQEDSNNPVNNIDVDNFSSPTFADIDGDGKLDAIVGEASGALKYYKNTGTTTAPVFEEQTGENNFLSNVNVVFSSRPTFVDLDFDGKLEIVIGEVNGTLRYYKNTGSLITPAFTEQTGSDNPFSGINVGNFSSPTFVDLDNDLSFDLVVGALDGTLRYYKNTGSLITPAFTEQTGSDNPFSGINVGNFSSPTFVDLDNDLSFDLVVGGMDGTLRYYENTDDFDVPDFIELTGSDNPFGDVDVGGYSSPTFADLNGDAELDAIVGEANGTLKYYEFVTITNVPALAYQEQASTTLIDSDLTVTDRDSIDFDGGSLTIRINSATSSDRLSISPDADFSLSASNLSYLGDLIGSISGGSGSDLVIRFNRPDVTPEIVTALLRRISYASTADDPPASRTVSFVLTEADGTSSTPLTKTITITGVNDAPVFTKGSNVVIDENAPAQSIDWATNISAIESGQTLTFEVTTDNDALFETKPAIDPATGKLSYTLAKGARGVANITVTLKDNGGTENGGVDATQQTFTLTVRPVNNAPSAVTLTNTTTAIAETTSTSTRIKVAEISITDDGLGTNTLTLSGADASFFEIDGNSLYLKANTVLDYETKRSYSVTVNADDPTIGSGADASQSFTLDITDVNEAPSGIALTNTTTTLPENSDTSDRIKVADIDVTDDELGTNNLSLSGADANFFEIANNALYLKANVPLNYQTKSSYSVTVNVDDPTLGTNPDASQTFTIAITEINEAPSAITLTNITTTIAENTDTATRIKIADITITDDDQGTNSLFLTAADADLFEIDNSALYLKAGTVINYEAQDLYDVTVNVKDESISVNPSASYSLTLTVTDVNEAPSALSLFNPISVIAENISTATRLRMADILIVDDALGEKNLSLTGVDASLFEIVNNVLYLKAGTAIDYETKSNYSVTVEVDDPTVGSSPDASQTFNLRVSDVQEASDPAPQPSEPQPPSTSPIPPTSPTPEFPAPIPQSAPPFTFTASLPFKLKRGNPIAGVVYQVGKQGTPGSDSYEGDSGNNALWGFGSADRLLGKDGHDFLSGGDGNDFIDGGNGNDLIFGGLGDDVLVGGDGNDIILGRMGRDQLTGGSGKDLFVFAKPAEQPDRITDFSAAEGDRIVVLGSNFKGGLKTGVLAAKQFHVGTEAISADDRFIYNQRTGILSFDIDGSGSRKAIAFAQLAGSPNLTSASILVV